MEFIGRFLQHVLPQRLRHIRRYGFMGPRVASKKLPVIRALLGVEPPQDARDIRRKLRLLHKTSWKEGLCSRQSSRKEAQGMVVRARPTPRRLRFEGQTPPPRSFRTGAVPIRAVYYPHRN